MMTINSNTKIGVILKANPKALDAIISISTKFEKLRNPFLRKLMAGRTTLTAATKFGGCDLEDFYKSLEPLGFSIDRSFKSVVETKSAIPEFMQSINSMQLVELDVRPVLASGEDPLNLIMSNLKTVQPGGVLKVVNTFEPTPLILLLEKKGFKTYVEVIGADHINTYFFKKGKGLEPKMEELLHNNSGWDKLLERFGTRVNTIDVRHLEMPQPMMNILEALNSLPEDTALYVHHKRIPVFLLPELKERGFEYRIKEVSDNEVHLLIFKV
jgi:uncharacterized protein (DUF2249 family)